MRLIILRKMSDLIEIGSNVEDCVGFDCIEVDLIEVDYIEVVHFGVE